MPGPGGPPSVPCDDAVVAAARAEADRRGEVVPGVPSTPAEADVLRRSHLGLTAEESAEKAEAEGRRWRTGSVEGVVRPVTRDLRPGRITVTVCRGVVVEVEVETAPAGGLRPV